MLTLNHLHSLEVVQDNSVKTFANEQAFTNFAADVAVKNGFLSYILVLYSHGYSDILLFVSTMNRLDSISNPKKRPITFHHYELGWGDVYVFNETNYNLLKTEFAINFNPYFKNMVKIAKLHEMC